MKQLFLVVCQILALMVAFEMGSTASQLYLGIVDWPAFQAAHSKDTSPIPEASVECSPDVEKWWDQLRENGLQLLQLSDRLDLAMAEAAKARKANPNIPLEQSEAIWEKTVTPIEKAIDERRSQFTSLLEEGIKKQYQPPVASAKVIVLSTERPRYTEEARKRGLQGQVTLRVVLQADGRVTNIQVVQGLGYGLDEQAIEAVRKTVFLPSIVEGRFKSKAVRLVAEFNLR